MSEISIDQLNLDKDCWDIIDSYFNTVANYISKNQIDSFNMCLDEQIAKTLRQFNPIQSVYDYKENGRFEVDIYVGGSIKDDEIINDGMSITIGKPIIYEKKIVVDPDTGAEVETTKTRQLYPNEARLKNLTYNIAIYTDIHISYKYYEDNSLKFKDISTFKNKLLGRMPCMLQSKGCVLSAIPRGNLKEFGECPYDHGGYFIIDGKEKVITAQTRQIENKIYTKKNKQDDPNEYEAEIRSVPENTHQPARITRVYIRNPVERFENTKKGDKNTPDIQVNKSGIITVAVPNLTESIPIFILFRALGVTTDKEILQYICGDIDSFDNTSHNLGKKSEKPMSEIWQDYLYDNIYLASQVHTQLDALRYIQNIIRSLNPNKSERKDVLLDDKLRKNKENRLKYYKLLRENEDVDFKYIMDILYNWFIPHMGTNNFSEKAAFLGYMTRELLKTKWGMLELTDRDNYIYKRIDVGGFLMSTMFRDLYFRVRNFLEQSVNTNYNELYKKQSVIIDSQGATYKSNIKDLLVSEENISIFFNQELITDGFKYAFKNCWGLRNAPCKEGVVQDLARLTYLGMISHIRRVVTPLGASSKLRGPHMMHLSTYGILCPIETPDGANVGVKTNIAILTDITFGTNSSGIFQALLDNYLILQNQLPIDNIVSDKDLVTVFLNGRLVGYHRFPNLLVKRLKLLRRNALINIYTSIAWYIDRMEIKISTDSGRSCHPMLIVEENRLKMNRSHLKALNDGTINWYHLIAGRENWNQYDPRYYKTTATNAELEAKGGVIEFIDTEELNTCFLAINYSMLVNNPDSKFSHCEIHPCIIFGIMGSIIPYVQTNQLPRNLYSCGQGKQAIGVYASNYLNRMDTKTQVLYYPQKSLIQNRISKHLYNNTLPYGMNAIIGIACYTGYNQDDSIIFNKSALDRGLFRSIKYRTYSIREEENEYTGLRSKICNPYLIGDSRIIVQNLKPGNYNKLGLNGIIKEGVKADENDIICGKVIMTNNYDADGKQIYLDASEYIRRAETGTVDKTFFSYDNNGFMFVKVRLRKEKIPELGDKFASRSGQKGIMGMLLNEADMPVSARGVRPDMLINPQAFPKRMTISQFIESYFAKGCSLLGIFGDSSPFQTIPVEKIGSVLQSLGYERYGCELLYNGSTGEQLESDIFIGPTYYERLQHQVEDKIHSRAEGAVTMLSKQPTGGRSIGGGLRIGEMERDSLLAHGVAGFIKETMSDRSDSTDIIICAGCGQIAMANIQKNIYHCYNCNSSRVYYDKNKMHKEQTETSKNDFELLQVPYAMKLLTQELEGMSIQPHFITDNSAKKWKPLTEWSEVPIDKEETQKMFKTTSKSYYTSQGKELDSPFRKYQNIMKSILISGASAFAKLNSSTGRPNLIDLSAGRGGDIMKWIESDYEYILALDVDDSGLFNAEDNLTKRIEKFRDNQEFAAWFQRSKIDIGVSNSCENLFNGDSYKDTNPNNKKRLDKILSSHGPNSFDVASIQFSAHYCFDSILHINNLFTNISNGLKELGIALITTFDGSRVYSLLKKNGGQLKFEVDGLVLYTISFREEYKWDTLPNDSEGVNVAINVKLASTGSEITEYLVHPQLLLTRAKIAELRIATIAEVSNNFKYLQYPVDNMTNPGFFMPSNRVLHELFSDKRYTDLNRFAELFNYYILVKETPRQITFENLEQCEKTVYPQISTISSADVEYYSWLYSSKNTARDIPDETRVLTGSELELIRSNYSSRNIRLDNNVFKQTLDNSVSQTSEIVYVSIKNGKIVFYAPVVNSLGNIVGRVIPGDYDNIFDYYMAKFKVYPELATDPIVESRKEWRNEGCILKNTKNNIKWSDTFFSGIYHMLSILCSERTIFDTDILINKGYSEIKYPAESSGNYPILQFFENIYNKDSNIAIPSVVDWWLITKLFFKGSNQCVNDYLNEIGGEATISEWDKKSDKAVFRSVARGCDVKPSENNLRLKLAELVRDRSDVDAAFTGIDTSDIFIKSDTIDFLKKSDVEKLLEIKRDLVTYAELSKYKYIFSVSAYTVSLKLGYLLSLGSVVIKYELENEPNKLWFEKYLTPFNPARSTSNAENCDYISVCCESDLDVVLEWCHANDKLCSIIANNGKTKINRLLTKDAVLDYLQYTINMTASGMIYKRSVSKSIPEIEYHIGSVDVEKRIADLIEFNKEIITGYFNLDTMEFNGLINHNGNRYFNIRFSGTYEFQNAKKFLESISDWITGYINNVSKTIIKQINDRSNEIEKVFNIYLMIDSDEVVLFGEQENVDRCIEYITDSNNGDSLDMLPSYRSKQIRLKVNRNDMDIGVHLEDLAIVFPTVGGMDNEKIVSHNVDLFREILQKYNIRPFFMEIHQKEITTLERIPSDIVAKEQDGDVILKPNVLGLFAIASRLVPKKYKKILIMEPGCKLRLDSSLQKRLVSVLSGFTPVVRMGDMLLFNSRNLLTTIPPYLFGAGTEVLDQFLSMPIPIDKEISVNQFIRVNKLPNNPMEKDFILKDLPSSKFFKITEEREETSLYKYVEVDFSIGALPLVLASEKRPDIDPKSTTWIADYIGKYVGRENITITKRTVEIKGDVDNSFIKRLADGIEQVLLKDYGIITGLNVLSVENKIIIQVVSRQEKEVSPITQILPYYTINHQYYIHDITLEDIETVSKLVISLKENSSIDKSLRVPSLPDSVQIVRIGNYVIYYNGMEDNINIYSLTEGKIISDKPELLESLDLPLLLIMYKDKNESLLKLIFPKQSRPEFHNIPKIGQYIGVKGVERLPINKHIVRTLTRLEPPIFDWVDKVGYVD